MVPPAYQELLDKDIPRVRYCLSQLMPRRVLMVVLIIDREGRCCGESDCWYVDGYPLAGEDSFSYHVS